MRMCGELADGETADASPFADLDDILNMMLKSMQADGLKLWLRKKATVFLRDGVTSYALNSTGAHATYSYTRTTVKVDAAAVATSIDVTSTTGMTAGDFIGFELNDGTDYWTTIATVVDSDSITIGAPGLTSAADIGNFVYFYTTKMDRPLRILQAVLRDSDSHDTSVDIIAQQDYMDLSSKTEEGSITQVHYDPQTSAGVLYVWPSPESVTSTLELIVERTIEDMDNATDDFDVPQEWYEPILYGLAERAALFFHANEKITILLGQKADDYLRKVMNFDVENTSLFLSPRTR